MLKFGFNHLFQISHKYLIMNLFRYKQKMEPVQVTWTGECEPAFKKLKEVLISNQDLMSPDVSRSFAWEMDASDQGVGTV